MTGVLVLGHAEVTACLPTRACVDAMAAVLAAHARGEVYQPLRSVVRPPAADGTLMGLMPAHRAGDCAVYALKAVCIVPANSARGLDPHQGTVTLFDGGTGRPIAILDAAALTAVRTAAVSALATRLLARPDARVLAVIGAGVQAAAHITALLAERRFASVRIYAPTAEHAHALAERTAAEHGVRAERAASAEAALEGADVVVTATNAREPVLRREWLPDGAHVNAVGASVPSARELDTATIAASALFVDSRESAAHEAGDYQRAVESGAVAGPQHIRAELGEVVAGLHPGRRESTELTVFRSLGLAIEDLAAAELAAAEARRRGVGTEVAW
jgi:ornithine cyclodeaminase